MCLENFVERFLAALGFLSGVIALLSGLIMTMTWLHFSVPFGLNVKVSSFLLMLSFMILVATSIVAPVVLKNEVHMHKRIPDYLRDIFCDSHWMPDRLICYLQMQGSRDQGIMIQLIVDYLWYDGHDCSVIKEPDQTFGCQSDKRWFEHLGHPSYQKD
jgi:hypothetical protein